MEGADEEQKKMYEEAIEQTKNSSASQMMAQYNNQARARNFAQA